MDEFNAPHGPPGPPAITAGAMEHVSPPEPRRDPPPAAWPTRHAVSTRPPAPIIVRQGARWWQTVLAAFLGATLAVAGLQLVDTDDPASSAPAVAIPSPQTVDANPSVADSPTTAGATDSGASVGDASNGAAATVPSVPDPDDLTAAPPTADAVAVGEKVIPSIVTVEVVVGDRRVGSGSGVIISSDGFIVTNDHVISVGSTYRVVLSDGRTTYEARLMGTDPLTDLAVLDIDATGLVPIEFGSAAALSVGDAAVAVGSPLGLEGGPSLTVGVVSAFGRQVQTSATDVLYGMIQTDAPITSGSSGGALVDGAGRLIGITTAVGVSDVGVEGIGFATPVEIVGRIVDELVADGAVDHAFLGISGSTAFDAAADGSTVAAGVEINSVDPGSAAAAAALVAGDVITSIDGVAVETMDELIVALRVRFPGDSVVLTVNDVPIDVTLGSR